MAIVTDLLLYLAELWLIGGFVLLLHRQSPRFSLIPLALSLGGLVAMMEFQSTEWVQYRYAGLSFDIASHLLLPAFLLGLLVVYIVNGTTQARVFLTSMFLLTILAGLIQLILALLLHLPGKQISVDLTSGFSPRFLIATAVSLVVDMMLVIVVYQAASNLRGRYPSRTAGVLALLVSLWGDAFLYPVLAYGGNAGWLSSLAAHLIGKGAAGLLLSPLLVFYLARIAPALPGSAAAAQRPALDLFTTVVELEARAHYHHRLLRTLTQVNQLILRLSSEGDLLNQACKLLVNGGDYALAWIGLADATGSAVGQVYQSGAGSPSVEGGGYFAAAGADRINPPPGQVLQNGQALVLPGEAFFPMRHNLRIYGVFGIYANRPARFEREEIDLLQELADNLAYALHNLENRRQQESLFRAEQSQRKLAQALAQAAAALNTSLELEDTLDEILEQTLRVASCRSANIMLIEGEEVRVSRRRGYTGVPDSLKSLPQLRASLSMGTLHHMMAAGEPLLIPDVSTDPRWTVDPQTSWIQSYAGVPMKVKDQIIGFLNLDSELPGSFTAETIQRLQAFASHAAAAIHNARLYGDIRRHTLELEDRVRERTAELLAAKEGEVARFKELDRMKTQFVSDVSHELRTPLANLTIYLDLLSSTQDTEKRRSYLEILRREMERLTHLIEDLLTITRLETGRVEMTIQRANINQLISELVTDRAVMARRQGLSVTCQLDPADPAAWADAHLLGQALSNLLTNATLYTPAGGTVSLSTQLAHQDGRDWAIIAITDTGAGLTAEDKEHIFERFYRGSASQLTKSPGTGLGLPISKESVERMGGKITFESTPGQGSTFMVWLQAVL